jgi:hypothetical protein
MGVEFPTIRRYQFPNNLLRMSLDDSQRQKVAEWIQQGLSLSEIQNRLSSELGVRLTYMEVRFLMDDLKLKPKDKDVPKTPAPDLSAPPPTAAKTLEPEELEPEDIAAKTGTGVSVTVDQLARPGAMVSGKVTFSDGKSAEWYLDQYGRLGLAGQEKGYRPPAADLADFQTELQSQLAKLGY